MRQHPSIGLQFALKQTAPKPNFSQFPVHGLNSEYSRIWAAVLSAEFGRQSSHRMRRKSDDVFIYSHTGRSVHAKLEGNEWRFYACGEGGTISERIFIAVAARLLESKLLLTSDHQLALAAAKESHRVALAACTKMQLPKEFRRTALKYSA